jgi:hypothetical protein
MYEKVFCQKEDASASRGQSMVELALLFPVLLILLSGLIEFGFILNQYLSLMDAARNAARFASDGLYYETSDSNMDCATTTHFYWQTACLVNQELRMEAPTITLNDNGTPDFDGDDYLDPTVGNDILISAFGFIKDEGIVARYPGDGWYSYAEAMDVTSDKVSRFTIEDIEGSMVSMDAPNTGYILVEIFYYYDQKLKLPWITAVIDDPLLLHTYAFMPLPSAEPDVD